MPVDGNECRSHDLIFVLAFLSTRHSKFYFDREGNTLSVWFDDPKKEHVCEESDDDVILVKDRRGSVIGFERLNFLSPKQRKEGTGIPLEVQMV